jgi:hypothetical protein
MTTIASRLTNTGTLLVNGSIDEVTFNTSSPTITNLFYYSQDFSSASYWQRSSTATLSNVTNILAPDNTTTAQLITVGGTGLYPYIRSYRNGGSGAVIPCTPGTSYTVSSYVKYVNQQFMTIVNEDAWTSGTYATFDLINANINTKGANVAYANISSVGNNWYRISATYVPTPAGITYWNPQPIRVGKFDGTNYTGSNVYVWGAQLEAGNIATTYQGIASAGTLVTPTFATKTVPNAVYATGQFDEVTYSTGFAKRETQTGNLYVTGSYDEFTGAPVVDSSLKCWLDASQTASYPGTGTIWYDLSNNGSNAVLNGVSYNNTSVAMNFTGGSISIPVGNVANITTTTAVTASVWFNSTTADTSYRRLISRDSYPTQNWYIEYNGAAASVGNVFSYSGTASTGNTPITSNIWYNLTMTATASNVCLYKNGTLTIYNGTATTFLANTSAIGIGADANGWSQFLGNISQVMVYNRALSPDEVAQNFNALRRRYNI